MTDTSDKPIAYLERIRAYYLALGYGTPYSFAHYDHVPFHRPEKPMAESRLAIVTTAAPFQAGKGDQGPGAPYNGAAKFFSVYSGPSDRDPDLRIAHVAIDRDHTTAEDQNSYFPLPAFRRLVADGCLGALGPRFHGLPTNRSQKTTRDVDCPELSRRCREDAVDAVVLVANCPVCHQSVSLAARHLEEAGLATVVLGCARDIVEHVGVPRFVFSDFPLGNAAGRPNDPASQDLIARLALDVLQTAKGPRTTVQSPLAWPGPADWKQDYSNAARLSPEEIARRRAAFDKGKQEAAQVRASG
ncbi:MAG: glycine reductase [Pseudomonadota bacterium]